MNIVGNANGYFNIVEFFNSVSTNINTYNSSLCAVQRASNTGGSLLTYRPTDGIPAFTQFTPNSGYVVLASNNFILPEDQLQPTLASRSFSGNTTGYFSIFKYNYTLPLNINTFNSSLCAVQRASNTGGSLLTYRPSDGIPAFTQFTPGSGYIILAKENLIINNPAPTPTPTLTPTPTPTYTPTPTPINSNYWLYAMGDNRFNQLGQTGAEGQIPPLTGALSAFHTFVPISGFAPPIGFIIPSTGGFNKMVCGDEFFVALSSRRVIVSGRNDSGQLSLNNYLTYAGAVGPLAGVTLDDVYCGGKHTIGLSGNQWVVCGNNFSGQLGLGYFSANTQGPNFFVPLSGNWNTMSLGSFHSFALSGKKLFSCGYNFSGQLGTGDSGVVNNKNIFTPLTGEWDRVVCGYEFTCALSAGTKRWYSTGWNGRGQLGLGDYNDRNVLTPISGEYDNIVCGGNTAYALSGGVWFATGSNIGGKLGLGIPFASLTAVSTFTPITGNWQKLVGIFNTTYALSGGKWFGVGSNFYGQLGRSPNEFNQIANFIELTGYPVDIIGGGTHFIGAYSYNNSISSP